MVCKRHPLFVHSGVDGCPPCQLSPGLITKSASRAVMDKFASLSARSGIAGCFLVASQASVSLEEPVVVRALCVF